MIEVTWNENSLTRDLTVYLENQVKINLSSSGIGLSLFLGIGAAYVCYYLSTVAKKPQLITGSATLSKFLRRHCPVVTETYYPTFWCWESRVQTLLRPLITAKPWVEYRNELIKTVDGGHISLDWNNNDDNALYPVPATRPTILILPGLTGSSKESYVLHMVKQSERLGYRCVVFNNRGVAGERLLTPRTYCAANTEDLEMVILHVRNAFPEAPLMAAGVSMGGMLLLNYLCKIGQQTPLKAAVVFSIGWDVFACTASLEKPLNRILFNYYLTNRLQASVYRHRQILNKLFNIDYIMKAKTIREFDERFTSVMFGYKTNVDYYKDASPSHKLKSIEVPVLCLNALDDVFSPAYAIPMQSAKQNPNVALLLTAHGGHIGFLEGIFPRRMTYMDRIFKQFIQAVVEHKDELKSI
ncbi:phospholipase ABHD3 isoform X1 [Mobula hypostoma]|uniref:phospholipase ABHD3 isoform X1 n=2 Tax=Mobula hypostoma TaxID=723540 RepID=UPI002FC2D2C5